MGRGRVGIERAAHDGDAPVRFQARAAILGLALGAVTAAAQIRISAEETTFRVDVNLNHVLVTVKDANGGPVADLKREDFTVLDGGQEREIRIFEHRSNRALSVALLVDASLSTAKELPFERDSASRFFNSLLGPGAHPSDRAAVFKFSDFVEMLSGFTNSPQKLRKALRQVQPETGTSVYDAILLASEQLGDRGGRGVMVIITDGGDTTSRVRFSRALEAAHDADAVIYAIIVVPISADAGRNVGGEHALKTLAANTGGTTFIQFGTDDLDKAFSGILENLRTQYLIGYYPPEYTSTTERFRRIEIKVGRPDVEVFARNGYFIPKRRPPPFIDKITIGPARPRAAKPADPPAPEKPPAPKE